MIDLIARENDFENDLFFVCSLIEFMGRKTLNKRIDIIQKIDKKEFLRILELSEIYHCEPIEKISYELIQNFNINLGNFDNVKSCKYTVPTVFDIGKVYKRLIFYVINKHKFLPWTAFVDVYSSLVARKIDDYNASVYYENPGYIEYFYDKKAEPEKYEAYLLKFIKEVNKTISELPDYIKRKNGVPITPINFFKIMLSDTSETFKDFSSTVFGVIKEIIDNNIPLEEIEKDIGIDKRYVQEYFAKFA